MKFILFRKGIPYKIYYLLIASVLLFYSCSVEKNTGATRSFHNLTSHYNIYFNAEESYKNGLMRVEESRTDDFTSILPLFYYEEESVQQSLTSQMKRAIDKSTKVITFHSITAKPKIKKGKQTEDDKAFYEKNEYNKWVDDSYLLIGKAYMYQGDFFLATETFKHVIKTFPDEDAYYLGLTWLARAYNVIGELDESDEILSNLKDAEEYPEKELKVLYTTLADFHIRKENYTEAAKYLELALSSKLKKNKRIRYTYILAQLYQEAEEGEKSMESFRKVIRMNPPYEMAFNAKVNMAEAFEAGAGESEEIRNLLNKMLKDSKNKEYRDQIYFALGNIAMEEGDREQAIEYYHLSVSTSVQNSYQKGESCRTLADIYYNEPMYSLSAAYYDTAVNLLPQEYPNFRMMRLRSRSLNDLVRNVNNFELQDSVQKLALLSEDERFIIIDGIIARVRQEEEEARLKQQQAMQDLQFNRQGMGLNPTGNFTGNTSQAGGKWYFYNINLKSFGQPEFRIKWGERKLEDNWRRKNKQTATELLEESGANAEEELVGSDGEIIDNKSREFYLKNIPLTDSALQISDRKLQEALYNMGMIYKNDLLDYDQAIFSFEELAKRYSSGDQAMASLYYLHELYSVKGDKTKAEYYKEKLKRLFPESHMAKLLTNPNYIQELEEEEGKSERFYERVYAEYQNDHFSTVIRLSEQGLNDYPDNKDLAMRLNYLKAMSVGAVRGKEAMKTELDSIVASYPGTDIAQEAQDVIDYMYVAFPVFKEEDQAKEAVALYTFDQKADHRLVIALRKSENLNLVNFNLLNYNLDNFNTYDLNLEMKQLGVDYNIVTVSGFSSFEGVSRYKDRVINDIIQIVGEISTDLYKVVLISEENLTRLIEAKEFQPYLLFYRQNYEE